MVSGPLQEAHHVCIVVRELDRAVAFYESIGIGPFAPGLVPAAFPELAAPEGHDWSTLTYAVAQIGPIQLQLVEPGEGDSLQRRFLEERGEGVFHIGFAVPEADAGERDARALGLPVLLRGRRPDGAGFTYFDTAAQAGVILQLRAGPRPAANG